jgi:carbon monoxide dehydrogenase subunit G
VKITSSAVVSAPPDRVFAALVDPVVLQQAIPGCEELVETGPDAYRARLKIGVAGLKGTYSGTAAIRDREPPQSLVIAFDGKGGPGFVRGTASIRLTPDGDQTRVDSDADVQVGGVIAAVGSRLIDAAAKMLSAEFFRRLAELVGR